MGDGFASLTSGLLARKGQARPAMRPQGFGQGQGQPDDLGWNDMGHDVPRPAGVRLPTHLSGPQANLPVHAEVPAVVRQREELAATVEAAVEAPVVIADPVAAPVETPVVAVVVPVPEPVIEAEPVAAPEPVAETAPEAAPAPVAATPRRRAAKKAQALPPVEAPRVQGRKAAFTLRLDADRHLRLRLACAVQNRSAQQIVIQALDTLLGDLPDVDRLAASLPAPKN